MKTYVAMSEERLGELISRFPKARVAVLGDFFLDRYLDVEPELAETSIETGKTAHQVVAKRGKRVWNQLKKVYFNDNKEEDGDA